ncbi:MAG: hypothetical protein HY287_11685 [Planctomycetes bacterium]|nr:hypothetical protein [Planctomycetota bacterium]
MKGANLALNSSIRTAAIATIAVAMIAGASEGGARSRHGHKKNHQTKFTSTAGGVASVATTSGAVNKVDPTSHLRYTGGAIDGDFTMMGYFKITINRGALSTFIIMGGPIEPTQRFINGVSMSTNDDGESYRIQGLVGDPGLVGPDLGVGGWHHLAMVGNTAPGSPIFGYIDGILAITGTINAGETFVPEMIEISGCWGQDVFRLAGSFCAMKIWSAQLSQSEIQSEMGFYRAVHKTFLWQEVPLRNTTDLFDLSGNGRDLVPSGPAFADDADGPDI